MIPVATMLSWVIALVRDGKAPAAIRDGVVCLALVISTVYVARMDKRFEGMDDRFKSIESSIAKMSDSVINTSQAVALSAETTGWHGKEIQRHSREIERLWDKSTRLEQGMRGGGLEIPNPKTAVAIPPKGP